MSARFFALPLALALIAPAPALAAPSLQGTYAYVAADSDDVDKIVDATVAEMSFFIRVIAHQRLQKTNVPYKKVAIAGSASEVSITTDARAPIVTTGDGAPLKWKREDGQVLEVSTRWKGSALEQTFAGEDGKRVNVYTPAPDGKHMWMDVTVTSSKLPKPLKYRLAYERSK